MDFWIHMGITAVLQLLANKKEAPKYFAALAKIYHKIHLMAQLDPRLQAEIEHQEAKAGGR